MCLNKRHQIDVVFCLLTLRERHTVVLVRVGPPPPPPVVKYSSRLFSEGALRLRCVGFNSVCVVIRSRFNGFAVLVVFKMCFKCRWKINPLSPSLPSVDVTGWSGVVLWFFSSPKKTPGGWALFYDSFCWGAHSDVLQPFFWGSGGQLQLTILYDLTAIHLFSRTTASSAHHTYGQKLSQRLFKMCHFMCLELWVCVCVYRSQKAGNFFALSAPHCGCEEND